MKYWHLFQGLILFIVTGTPLVYCQSPGNFVLDATRPLVYIEFDHAGPREPLGGDEPKQGLWLRLVNNSIVPIEVEEIPNATKSKLILLPVDITPTRAIIPKSGLPIEKKPAGYASGLGVVTIIPSGKDVIFSVPANYVSPYWFMQVPFQFSLPPVKRGWQPNCYALFSWEDLPESYRDTHSKPPSNESKKSKDSSGHSELPKKQ